MVLPAAGDPKTRTRWIMACRWRYRLCNTLLTLPGSDDPGTHFPERNSCVWTFGKPGNETTVFEPLRAKPSGYCIIRTSLQAEGLLDSVYRTSGQLMTFAVHREYGLFCQDEPIDDRLCRT